MKLSGIWFKPEYVFRPAQVIRRLSREWRAPEETEEVRLPWGLSIRVHPHETIGSCIWRTGVHDLIVTEVLWRLLDEGEIAVDVGANIGYMTGVMARRVGARGRVIAMEPHPEIFEMLRENVDQWAGFGDIGSIGLVEKGASSIPGKAVLHMPPLFGKNRGVASLENPGGVVGGSCEVDLATLDSLVDLGTRVGVLKLDVEGHESAALDGAAGLLGRHDIRDIVFEEHGSPPTPVTERLARFGYRVFFLDGGLWGPRMLPLHLGHRRRQFREHNCLATIDPTRALDRLAPRGWRVLRARGGNAIS